MELNCPVKQYHWGKQGSQSLVAQLKHCADSNFEIEEDETYAELWMGTHPSGPAVIKQTNVPLDNWVKKYPCDLGEVTIKNFGKNIPFLFKVLSINMPLSIQVHPSQHEAAELHRMYPDVYKDPNHKPELAIALSDFEALCGFRPIEEIKQFLQLIPELKALIGQECCREEHYIQSCFGSLMRASHIAVRARLEMFLNRMANEDHVLQNQLLFNLIIRIHNYFPGDVGCFCIYFLNYLILKPGDAIFLEPNQPHAYISGDCVECMACSDNVIRAGLTPKFRDVETLCRIVNYIPSNAESRKLYPEAEDMQAEVYRPPTQEFAVRKLKIKPGESYSPKFCASASIAIVIRGCGLIGKLEMRRGKVFFMKAGKSKKIEVPLTASEELLIFQAFINI